LTQSQRATALVSNNLYWGGSEAAVGNGGQRPKVYAPATYAPGSSTSHLDEAVHGGELMSPFYSGVDHTFSDIEKGMLLDMGWNVSSSGGSSPGIPTDSNSQTTAAHDALFAILGSTERKELDLFEPFPFERT
jgi:hypothetical protein